VVQLSFRPRGSKRRVKSRARCADPAHEAQRHKVFTVREPDVR
jgi:hypothetical protein